MTSVAQGILPCIKTINNATYTNEQTAYILLTNAYGGSNYVPDSVFAGQILLTRGGSNAFTMRTYLDVFCSCGYENNSGSFRNLHTGGTFGSFVGSGIYKIKYNDKYYLGVKLSAEGKNFAPSTLKFIGTWWNAVLTIVDGANVTEAVLIK